MAAINDLIARIEDKELRRRIEEELRRLLKQKKFGLVFEDHQPEGLAEGPVYPCLQELDRVSRAPGDTLWHTLIEADNYYALQLLAYLYPGQVDCIYIDPPYNTGARDWKYNNDYVDSSDQYRHSKWLSMMKRRLKLAKRLLNPRDSVLIVTIDEKEYLHLGCLLEEMFPEARMQMVSDVINPSGSSRKDMFSRSDEYIFFLLFGDAKVVPNNNNMLYPVEERKARWDGLVRRGATGKRTARPNLFYPLFFRKDTGKFVGVGQSLPLEMNRNDVVSPENCFALFPISMNGDEATWGISSEKFIEKYHKGYIRFGEWKPGTQFRTVAHLQEGMIAALERGEIDIQGRDEEGAYILGVSNKPVTPMTTWVQQSHSAGDFGTRLLKSIFPVARFSFPKSLYAVHDTIRFFVANKPNALIVDFFAGSGTTLHAVNLLNAEDGGHRRCIMVTNNEVSEQEAKALARQGFKPGDDEWERLGIARYVTWPRTVCSIEGHDVNGQPLKGEYLVGDASKRRSSDDESDGDARRRHPLSSGFDANCIFFKLAFLDKTQVTLGRQFRELLPLLWMKAGAVGPCPEMPDSPEPPDNPETPESPESPDYPENPENPESPKNPDNPDNPESPHTPAIPVMLVLPANGFAVLTDEKAFGPFYEQVSRHDDIRMVYLVVDSDSLYHDMARCFTHQQTCQLYRDYLDNFSIHTTR